MIYQLFLKTFVLSKDSKVSFCEKEKSFIHFCRKIDDKFSLTLLSCNRDSIFIKCELTDLAEVFETFFVFSSPFNSNPKREVIAIEPDPPQISL